MSGDETINCANCGQPIPLNDLPDGTHIPDDPHDPYWGGGNRAYCSTACAAEKQGWAYDD